MNINLAFIILTAIYALYILFIFLYSKKAFAQPFSTGNRREWIIYISGAIFTYISTTIMILTTSGYIRIILFTFAFWSFFILCFVIINTSEKAKQRYESEMAREIISSGREYYQKTSELQQSLQILRHDYKYHLMTINQMISSDNKDSVTDYLSKLEQQFSKSDLPRFCTNTVINALLAGYSERCANLNVQYNTQITLPEPLTIPDYDMCIVLGNLLENAINVYMSLSKQCIIALYLGFKGGQLSIVTENTFDECISSNDRLQVIEGTDDDLVIKSIRAVANRYNGEFEVEWNENKYTAYVLMSL